ncbi:MAG: ribosome silencing factor [Clostridiales bacterium]|nr:ribosome silencing factor [Clostridiales bacterium]
MTSKDLAREIVKILNSKKAENIKVVQTAELTIIADHFVIASGTSSTHTKSLADDLDFEMSKLGVEPLHIEGRATGWTLLDYNSVLVHVFDEKSRDYYNLERLWPDADLMDISDILTN